MESPKTHASTATAVQSPTTPVRSSLQLRRRTVAVLDDNDMTPSADAKTARFRRLRRFGSL